METAHFPRQAGMFVPVFALRSRADLGVGDTDALRRMIDWCSGAGFRVLQILPVNETSDDNSPYNAVSAQALDITTLALYPGAIPGLDRDLYHELCNGELLGKLRSGPVAYRAVKVLKWELCWRSFQNFEAEGGGNDREWHDFLEKESDWLGDYALFRVLMEHNGGFSTWESWQVEHRTPEAAKAWLNSMDVGERGAFETRMRFYSFVQWQLHRQWDEVCSHADKCGVRLMGDVPFGISRQSVDVWANPGQFDLKWSGGAPPEPFFQPDEFTKVWGQNWGVPVYRWDVMERDGYKWWKRRVSHVARFFHLFRIDHVLGFYRIYAFPWRPEENALYATMLQDEAEKKAGALPRFFPSDDNSEAGRLQNRRQGECLLEILQQAAGDSVIVGEDLGVVPTYVRPSLASLQISGFKIPLFERQEWDREFLKVEDYPELTVATLATHDHETMAGIWESWWQDFQAAESLRLAGRDDPEVSEKGKQSCWELYRTQRFAGLDDKHLIRDYEPQVREALCRKLLSAKSWLAILMITDVLGLKIRFNVPGPVAESNWSERLPFLVEEIGSDAFRRGVTEFVRNEILRANRDAG